MAARRKLDPKSAIDRSRLPSHLAIIMDGNGRWAKRRGLPRVAGHKAGIKSVRAVVEASREIGVPVLTLYAFSSENWKRPRAEVSTLMRLLQDYLRAELDTLCDNGIRLQYIGHPERMPKYVQHELTRVMERTAENDEMVLNLALNYGARTEIVEAAQRFAADVAEGTFDPGSLTEGLFNSYLQTAGLPDPDLIIRTSGESRLSNFMLWQASYAEIYISDVNWPQFGKEELYHALTEFQGRQRRFGGV